jgi:hypothetical protein
VFVAVVRELSAAVILFTSETKVLSVLIFDLKESGDLAAIAVLGLTMLILTCRRHHRRQSHARLRRRRRLRNSDWTQHGKTPPNRRQMCSARASMRAAAGGGPRHLRAAAGRRRRPCASSPAPRTTCKPRSPPGRTRSRHRHRPPATPQRRAAAFINGTAAHGEDFDDTFEGGPVHAGAVIVPAVLAARRAEKGCDGQRRCSASPSASRPFAAEPGVPKAVHKAGFHPTAVFGR